MRPLAATRSVFTPLVLAKRTFLFLKTCSLRSKKRSFKTDAFVEFYAGVGVIGLTVAPLSKSVLCVEMNPFAKESFEKSSPPSNASFLESPTENALGLLNEADVVIVDPRAKV